MCPLLDLPCFSFAITLFFRLLPCHHLSFFFFWLSSKRWTQIMSSPVWPNWTELSPALSTHWSLCSLSPSGFNRLSLRFGCLFGEVRSSQTFLHYLPLSLSRALSPNHLSWRFVLWHQHVITQIGIHFYSYSLFNCVTCFCVFYLFSTINSVKLNSWKWIIIIKQQQQQSSSNKIDVDHQHLS